MLICCNYVLCNCFSLKCFILRGIAARKVQRLTEEQSILLRKLFHVNIAMRTENERLFVCNETPWMFKTSKFDENKKYCA